MDTEAADDIEPAVLSRARRGDMDAHALVYRRHAPGVYTLARRMLNDAAAAEDVLQDTFIEVMRKLDDFRGDAALGTWIRRIAVNKCLMHLRSAWTSRAERVEDDFASAPSPADTGRSVELATDIGRALALLPDAARVVIWLHDVEGYTHVEIGRLMGQTASYSKSQLSRGYRRLRELLGESEDATCAQVLRNC
jgi:RNA polymerase sigma-70 factor (ECF subfamily)